MKKINRFQVTFVATILAALLVSAQHSTPAGASSWGAPQTISSWNYWNGRCTDNNELETYSPACVYYQGSTLIIKTYSAGGGVYYSGRITSQTLYGYGTYSFTANMPHGDGLLPAVWAAYLDPWLPEMDAAEIVGNYPTSVYQTFHNWNNNQTQFAQNTPSSWWTDTWHTYSFTWLPTQISFAIDGTTTGTVSYATGTCGMHFIIDTAVGGNWPGNPDSTTWNTPDGARYLKVSSVTYTPYYP